MSNAGVTIAFYVLAVVVLGSTISVVTVRNVFHAALYLVLSFIGVAGLYITLSADFVAAVQILIYAGAVAILFVFAVMLTHGPEQASQNNRLRAPAFFVAALLFATLAMVMVNTTWSVNMIDAPVTDTPTKIAELLLGSRNAAGELLSSGFVLPFEVASVLLLAAMVGAIVVARED
ncbi:MAG: NADH-quinone oxidoreductase subunit J [Chloroflexi bacterium]|nr:NADH-quinone oxidoreductase subunit J [Chloroflexota bacterium]